MTFIYKEFANMSRSAMGAILDKQEYHGVARRELVAAVTAYQKEQKALAAKRIMHRRLWGDLIDPLDYEIRLVKRMMQHDPVSEASEERDAALRGYNYVLQVAHRKLHKAAGAFDLTPTGYAKEYKLPNNGAHWTDWVKFEVKEAVTDLFDAVPRQPKVKRKIPFERKIPASMFVTLKQRLLERTRKELEHAIRLNKSDYSDALAADIKQMEKALEYINEAAVGQALPTTWHGFYK